MKYLLTLLIVLLECNILPAQNLIESRQTSYYTYIFKLDNREAGNIYKKDIWKVDDSYLHTRVDSFPTDSVYKKNLPVGHYLKVHTERNKLKFDITSVQGFDVMIARNNTDLIIRVFDNEGRVIPDADVRIRWKIVRFDKRTQSYVDRKSNQKGLLQVTWQDFTAYYNLSRSINNSAIRRTTLRAVYGTPVKYVWLPVRYAISLPVDGVKSLVNGYPQGVIQRTGRFFTESYYKIACLFDDYYCDYFGNNSFQSKHQGYIVFNKPKYMPGDTVKLKAFIVNKHGRPIDDPVNVVLQKQGGTVQLSTVNPYREGGYVYDFYLHDSLELQLDRSYRVWLEKRDGKEYISETFYYEDYELKSLRLALSTETDDHYAGSAKKIVVSGKDENDLNILDGRLQVFIRTGEVLNYFSDYVFIPDTLAFWNMDLEKEGETEIVIPDSVFPNANLEYEVAVTLLTSDNENITERRNLHYYHFESGVTTELINDSIQFSYKYNGKAEPVNAIIYGVDNFGNRKPVYTGILPKTELINPYYSEYLVDADTISKKIRLSSEPSLIQCFSERSGDSIQIVIKNPRNLPFSYYIYKRNSEKDRGYTDSLRLQVNTSSRQIYYVSIQYLWGGRMHDENYQIPYNDKSLNITVLEPKVVYPSQKVSIELLVTDTDGNPVPDVDVTAYSITKKFDYSPPDIPYLGKRKRSKSIINNFKLTDPAFENQPESDLDYKSWSIMAGIDSIEYYKFIYPGNEIYRFTYDSEITQFSPFVVSEGNIVPIHVIYVDSKPVYFSWSTHTQPYSFHVDTGYHNIRLRTTHFTVEIDSLFFNAGQKSIISVWDSIVHPGINISKEESRLSDFEKGLLYRYIFPYQYRHGEYYGYIEQNDQVQFLKPSGNYRGMNLAGPINPNQASFHLVDSFSLDFTHESFFEYDFMPGLLKLRSIDPEERYPDLLYSYLPKESLSDEVLTEADIVNGWNEYREWKRYSTARYSYPRFTTGGMGKMEITIKDDTLSSENRALNILIFRYDDHKFLRIYPGNNMVYNDLPEGFYKLLFFYPGSEYSVLDSVYVAPNGLNFYQIPQPVVTKRDTFSMHVSKIIEDNIFRKKTYSQAEETEIKQIYNEYQQEFRYTGNGELISGFVYDQGGTPIPGVSVVVRGTTFGTVTNVDGYYSLNVPRDRNELIFSFVGFREEVVNITYKEVINVSMTEDMVALEEVVVIGYGVQRKSALSASVSVVSATGISGIESEMFGTLQGKISGVQILAPGIPGSAVSIMIRGSKTVNFDSEPLYIIDGVVYIGEIGELNPDLIENIQILKGEQATVLYGAQGANGVVIINTGGGFKPTVSVPSPATDYDETFLEEANQASSIRNNFSDYAFWNPKLITDSKGKVTFSAQFPDDVTNWRTFYLAMNGHKQSGQTEGSIKSYKPLMAQLAVPRFLVEGDSAYVIGKVLNYTQDSVSLTTRFELDNKLLFEKSRYCSRSLLDTFHLIAGYTDSLSVKYFLEKDDGYFDGEQKYIPVYQKGMEQTEGQFHSLHGDTSIVLSFDTLFNEVTIYARADIIEVIKDEISTLINYKYSCNEQLASKLKALLSEQMISLYKGEKSDRKNETERVIRLLLRNQKEEGLWGWWRSSRESSLWISLHVLEALTQARDMGYRVNIDDGKITDLLVWELESPEKIDSKLRALSILKLLNSKVNFPVYLERLAKTGPMNMNELFRFIELKQICGLDPGIDTINSFRKETIFGNLYFSNDSGPHHFYKNDIQNTLLAYRILRSDSISDHSIELQRIRNYLFENKADGSWLNTFETAKIIETILPELLGSDMQERKPILTFGGSLTRTVDEFPFEVRVSSRDTISVTKRGDFPVYLTAYSHYWNPAPVKKKSEFEVSTRFDNSNNNMLKAGEPIKMITSVRVHKDADYVMINVPVPAGCSYGNKTDNSFYEVHREYFRNETVIFCESLPSGDHEFAIELIPRYTGRYTLNPAKVEMMYFPAFNANNEIKKVTIK